MTGVLSTHNMNSGHSCSGLTQFVNNILIVRSDFHTHVHSHTFSVSSLFLFSFFWFVCFVVCIFIVIDGTLLVVIRINEWGINLSVRGFFFFFSTSLHLFSHCVHSGSVHVLLFHTQHFDVIHYISDTRSQRDSVQHMHGNFRAREEKNTDDEWTIFFSLYPMPGFRSIVLFFFSSSSFGRNRLIDIYRITVFVT